MAIQFPKHFTQDLNQDIKIRQCGTIVFNADDLSNVVSVDLYNGDTPATPAGTVVGAVICSDGSTVPIDNGTISGNTVSITLTAACFAIPGQIGVGIQLVDSGVKTTVLKAIYNVERFETDDVIDPDSRITMSVSDLIDDIAAAIATIPADYSDLMAAVAPTFSTSDAYAAGAYVWYDGELYKFTTAHAAGSWNSAEVTAVALANEVAKTFSVLPASAIPWELGGVTRVEGIATATNRLRMAVKLRTKTPMTITSTTQIVWAVYDLSGNRLTDECEINWVTGTYAFKADRLVHVACRKSDNSTIADGDRAGLIAGISFTFAGDVAEVLLASRDADGNFYPTLGDAIISTTEQASIGDDFALSLVTLLKGVAYTSESGSALIASVANALTQTFATVYNFEPHSELYSGINNEYLKNNNYAMTTQTRYFPVDAQYNYKLKVDINTSAKVWLKLQYLNNTAKSNIDNRQNYSSSDYSNTDYVEITSGEYTFTPNGITINGLPPVAVRLQFGFGATAGANTVSLTGNEFTKFTLERTVRV